MDNADYLDVALRLTNATLSDVAGPACGAARGAVVVHRAGEADLAALRPVAAGLRRALACVVAADADGVLREVNALLAAHPLRPRLSAGHSAEPELAHPHGGPDRAPGHGGGGRGGLGPRARHRPLRPDRWGHCGAADCDNYYLDTSTNRAKRFCSPRCANRVHVAAFRSRRRDG